MSDIFSQLEQIIQKRMTQSPEQSYVAQLNNKGIDTILKKIGEESTEVVIAAKDDDSSAVIYESCDLIFHLMVLLANKDIKMDEIRVELERRLGTSGIAEKAARQK